MKRQHRLKHTSKDGDDRQANWLRQNSAFLKSRTTKPRGPAASKTPTSTKTHSHTERQGMQSGFKKEKDSSTDPEIIEIMKLADKKIRNLLKCKGNQGQKKRTTNLNR